MMAEFFMRIYLCPALMDTLAFLVSFAVLYGAGARHMTTVQCAWLGAVWMMAYMPASLAVGLVLTRRNARTILLASTVLCIAAGIFCLLVTGFIALLISLGLMGVMIAFVFNSFQTFMRGESSPGSLTLTVGRYTLAWSLGSSLGFLLSGFCYTWGWPVLVTLTLMIGAAILAALIRHRPRALDAPSAEENVEQGSARTRPVNPIYIWIGWAMIFITTFIQRPIFTFYPALNAGNGVSAWLTSLPLFLLMVLQGVFGWGMIYFRHALYRRLPLVLFNSGAILVLLAMWLWPTPAVTFIGISALGIVCGFFFFSAVYYASNSGRRSWNIGINEFLVGLGSLAGLFFCEWGVKLTARPDTLYGVCGLAVLLFLGLQLFLARRPAEVINSVSSKR